MSVRRTHCCVIGGGGFIGAHLLGHLLAAGRRVTVLGRSPAPSEPLPEGVRYIAGDYGDHDLLSGLLSETDEIVHLAYATVPQTSFEDPVGDIAANLPPSVRLFEQAARRGLARLVLVSSGGTVYGRARSIPLDEDHPTTPVSPYGITKLALEKYALMYHELGRLPVVIVRPGNAYGPKQRPFRGQGFVATAIASILSGRQIDVFGEQGTVRDYLHVTDLAAGIAAALVKGVPGTAYNIGSGAGHSNRDVIDALAPLAAAGDLGVRIRVLPTRQFDVPVNVLDCTRLTERTGWRPQVSLAKGIVDTWDWYKRNLHFAAAGAPQ
jgi:UDP-glucose 4-epimerase